MNSPVLTFFNNRGGIGKTALVYHLAWMYAGLGKRVVVLDLDPQMTLTTTFLDEEKIAEIWDRGGPGSTVFRCVKPLTYGGECVEPVLQKVTAGLYLLPGDIGLSGLEEVLSDHWSMSLENNAPYRSMRILGCFRPVMVMAARSVEADIILVDTGPNPGAVNRSVLISTDYLTISLGADFVSLQSLESLGYTLWNWKSAWQNRLENRNVDAGKNDDFGFELPRGRMHPIGYTCRQYGFRLERPITAYDKWARRIPADYRKFVLREQPSDDIQLEEDPYCLAMIKRYFSLMWMGQERRKPVFNLTPADGAVGSHALAVQDARTDYRALAETIAEKMGVHL
ncbi:MAG: ParA family protein [Methylobacteriaceae bacterium]|nr:ParA family protein [Methylobacteriaceae bacterium]